MSSMKLIESALMMRMQSAAALMHVKTCHVDMHASPSDSE